jgi:hypothetical protein
MSYTPPAGDEISTSWVGADAYTPPDGDAVSASWAGSGGPSLRTEVPSPLGVPAGLAENCWTVGAIASPLGAPACLAEYWHILSAVPSPLGSPAPFLIGGLLPSPITAVPSPLGAPAILVERWSVITAIPSPLGAPAALAVHDFTGALVDGTGYYVLDISGGAELLRLPMSSWQATQQTGYKQFLQAVVPAVLDYVSELSDRKAAGAELIVSRVARLMDGTAFEYELCRGPFGYLRLDLGAKNYSATLSGYADAAAAVADPAAYARTLSGVRSTSVAEGTVRARCAIDWLVRPGHQVTARDETFTVSWISYFVSLSDAYMDVGSRAA